VWRWSVCGCAYYISPSRISRENNSLEMIRLRRRTAVEIFCWRWWCAVVYKIFN